jgi:hypothetical protein
MIDMKEVLAVDGGLAYILSRYPQAAGCETSSKKKFSVRSEKSPSASIKRMTEGNWIVTDFGGDSKGRDAIKLAMLEDGIDFKEALHKVAAFYNIAGAKLETVKANYNSWATLPDEQEGEIYVKFKELELHEVKSVLTESAWKALDKDEIKAFEKAKALFGYYHYKALEYFRMVKDGKTQEWSSNERFPILYIDEGEFGKIYKPFDDKKYRFLYRGKKPKNFIHGIAQHKEFFKSKDNETSDAEYEKMDDDEKAKERKKSVAKIPEIIMCSGGSDALNVAATGYKVLWRNSETEEFRIEEYKAITAITYQLMNLPDIDATGIEAGHALAMQYLDMKTIWLPEEMLIEKDADGKPLKKDLRDFLRYKSRENAYKLNGKYEFDQLVKTSLLYRFWDEEQKVDKEGSPIKKFGRFVIEYRPNNLRMYNFLYRNGFARYKLPNEKEGYMFIRVQKGIVQEIEWDAMKDYINNFLEAQNTPEDLRNSFYRSPQLSESSMSNLPLIKLDFQHYGPDFQYMFFDTTAWRITAKGLEEAKQSSAGKVVWDNKILKFQTTEKATGKKFNHKPKLLPEPFQISRQENGDWDIEVKSNDCLFLNFMIQTSRVYWRREIEERLKFAEIFDTTAKQNKYIEDSGLSPEDAKALLAIGYDEQKVYLEKHKFSIDGMNLTEEEVTEQKLHLINKIYCIGYALHRFKFRNRPWAVWAMDNKLSDDGEAHGGAGKSILTYGIKLFLQTFILPGRQLDTGKMDFVFDGLSAEHDLVLSDDTSQYVDFRYFYEHLTSDMVVARKGLKSLTIPFTESPKLWFNSNFGDRQTDPSDQRRKIYTVFSDYYHKNTGEYLEDREPKDDFGKQLFDDFTESEWNAFYNTMARCLQFYLGCETKIEPPQGNVQKRNLISTMGEAFRAWADSFFAEEGSRLDDFIVRRIAQDNFYIYNKSKITPQAFMKKLKAWCGLNHYTLNPDEHKNGSNRIMRKYENDTEEFIFIKSNKQPK